MSTQTPNIGIIGCGRWGINHVRTSFGLIGERLRAVYDSDPHAQARVAGISPEIPFTTDKSRIINLPEIQGIIIATPAETHYALVKEALLAGKDVLVEKPMTLRASETEELVQIAESGNRRLMVGHILLYHPAIVKLKELLTSGKIGSLQYIYSNRLNLGAIRSEENILWSFAPHDVSVIQYLTGGNPVSIASHGATFVQNGIEDSTITYLSYPGNVHAHIFVSWLHPFKEQRMVVIGSEGMLVFEDSQAEEKLKFYPKGFKKTETGLSKFEGEYEPITIADVQPLAEEHRHFYRCIEEHCEPLTNGRHALEVLRILEQATQRLKHG